MRNYFVGILGVRCTTTTRPEDILNKFNSFLLMKGRPELNQILNQQVPLDVKTSLLVTILNQIRFLIILDNFEDCLNEDKNGIENPELKAFIRHLLNNTTRNTKFIITTRYDFDPLEGRLTSGIEHIPLPEFHFPQTNWIMNNYTELADLGIRKKKEIYNVIGGHPWTIDQFAKHAAVQGVDDLLLDLQSLKKDLIEFTLLDKSYSKLDDAARKLLLCTSIYEEAVPVEALSWIVGDEKDESPSIGEPLQKLLQWGLISKEQEYGKTVYSEHTIVKDFALKKLAENELDEKALLIRAARYYENLVVQTKNIWNHYKARSYYFRARDWANANKIVTGICGPLFYGGYAEISIDLLNDSIRTTSGVEKINAEYNLATVYYGLGDINKALDLYSNAKSNCENIGYNKGIANALYQLGMINQDQGEYKEAIKKYKQSLKISIKLGSKKEIAEILHQLGMIYHKQSNYRKAVNNYTQSLKMKKELKHKRGIANTLGQLGNVLTDMGNYSEAIKKYDESLKIFEELGDNRGIAIAMHAIGNVHYEQGNYEEAIKKYRHSINFAEKAGDKRGIAVTLHQIGRIHYHQGNYAEAVKKYNQSLKIFNELGDKKRVAETLSSIGMINQDQGNYKEAFEKYNQSLEIFRDLGNKRDIANTLGNIGIIHYLQGNPQEAVIKYNESLKIEEELGDKRGTATTLHAIGNILLDQGNYEEAIKKYNQSLKTFEDLGDKSGIAVTLGQLGRTHEEKEEYIFALQAYVNARMIFEKLHSPYAQQIQKYMERLKEKMGEEKFNAVMKQLE